MATSINSILRRPATAVAISVLGLLPLLLVAGCQEDDCVACVAPPPVAPTNVHSASGDGFITVYWDDDPEIYSDDITGYRVWSRYFQPGDELDPAREFYLIGEVARGSPHTVADEHAHSQNAAPSGSRSRGSKVRGATKRKKTNSGGQDRDTSWGPGPGQGPVVPVNVEGGGIDRLLRLGELG